MTAPARPGPRGREGGVRDLLADAYYLMLLEWLYRDSVVGDEVGFWPEQAALAAASGGVVAEGMTS